MRRAGFEPGAHSVLPMFGASSEQGRGPRAPRDQGFSRQQRVEIPDQVGQPSLISLRAGGGGL